MGLSEIEVAIATSADLPDLIRFFRAVEAAEHPDDPAAPDQAEAGLQHSLDAFDFLHTDACRFLLARVDNEPAGYLFAVRISKADERVGFFFVDEVYVLPAYRRRGVAQALLAAVQALAGWLGLAGVRLLVRPENGPARVLYRRCGFEEHLSIFCQWKP